MADKNVFTGDFNVKYKDMGDGTYAVITAFTADSPVNLTGDVVVDTLGALDDSAEVDPAAASATIPSLLRGELTELLAIKAAIGSAGDVAGTSTVIGLLKQIMINTTVI